MKNDKGINYNVGFYFNKDAEMVKNVFEKCFNSEFRNKTAMEIKFNVILRLNDLRIRDNKSIEDLSNDELNIKIYNLINDEIQVIRKNKENREWN